MKIALLMQSAANGGVQRVMINLAHGMIEHGAEIDFLIADATGEMMDAIPKECSIYDFQRRRYHGDLKVLLSMPPIIKYMQKHKDSVYIAAPGLACTVFAFLKIFFRNRKVMLINDNKCSLLLNGRMYHKIVYYVNKALYPLADRVIAAHRPALDDIVKNYSIKSSNACMIYHPLIDINAVKAQQPEREHPYISSRKEGEKILLAVGRLVPEKGFEHLIDAVEILNQGAGVKLIILGDGPERERLENRIKEKGLGECIDLYGYTDRVYSFMKSADLYVLSSTQEAFGNVLIEAMACGLPCVATDCDSGGPRAIMEQSGCGKYGVMCAKDDANALADAIRTALDTKFDKDDLANKSKQFEVGYSAGKYLDTAKGIGS